MGRNCGRLCGVGWWAEVVVVSWGVGWWGIGCGSQMGSGVVGQSVVIGIWGKWRRANDCGSHFGVRGGG